MKISSELLNSWDISVAELYKIAMENMKQRFPLELQRLYDIVLPMLRNTGAGDFGKNVYVAKTALTVYGAVAILYPDFLKEFCSIVEGDVVIIPSSVNEVILYPVDKGYGINVAESTLPIVREVNRTLDEDEVLSDNIYLYSPNKGLRMIS